MRCYGSRAIHRDILDLDLDLHIHVESTGAGRVAVCILLLSIFYTMPVDLSSSIHSPAGMIDRAKCGVVTWNDIMERMKGDQSTIQSTHARTQVIYNLERENHGEYGERQSRHPRFR